MHQEVTTDIYKLVPVHSFKQTGEYPFFDKSPLVSFFPSLFFPLNINSMLQIFGRIGQLV